MRRVVLPFAQLQAQQQNGTQSIVHGSGCMVWHSFYETTGAATASYALYDGPPTKSGQQLAYVTLSAGQSTRDFIGLHAFPFIDALHLIVESGSLGGSIICYVDHLCANYLHTEHEFYAHMREIWLASQQVQG